MPIGPRVDRPAIGSKRTNTRSAPTGGGEAAGKAYSLLGDFIARLKESEDKGELSTRLFRDSRGEADLVQRLRGPETIYETSDFPRAQALIAKGRPSSKTPLGDRGADPLQRAYQVATYPANVDFAGKTYFTADAAGGAWAARPLAPGPDEPDEAFQARVRAGIEEQSRITGGPYLNVAQRSARKLLETVGDPANRNVPVVQDILRYLGVDPASEQAVVAKTAAAPTPQPPPPPAQVAAEVATARQAPADETPWYMATPRSTKTDFFRDIPVLGETPWLVSGLGVGAAALGTALILAQQGQQQSDPVAYARLMQASNAY